jgi:hypothetical protein
MPDSVKIAFIGLTSLLLLMFLPLNVIAWQRALVIFLAFLFTLAGTWRTYCDLEKSIRSLKEETRGVTEK